MTELSDEFVQIDLADRRLNRRAVKVLEALGTNPSMSINAAMSEWGDTMAAYRFLDNDRVETDDLLDAHRAATEQRIAEEETVLLVQDTTELDFTNHPPRDGGVLNADYRFGFYDHTQAAFTPEGLCLGVLQAEFFNRTPESIRTVKTMQATNARISGGV